MLVPRLTLPTFALPLVLAACSNARTDGGDVPGSTESMPNPGTVAEQPSGSDEPPGENTEAPPAGAADGNGESLNPVTPL